MPGADLYRKIEGWAGAIMTEQDRESGASLLGVKPPEAGLLPGKDLNLR